MHNWRGYVLYMCRLVGASDNWSLASLLWLECRPFSFVILSILFFLIFFSTCLSPLKTARYNGKEASLKYNLAKKQTKIYAIWIESRKRTNKQKKKRETTTRLYTSIFLSRPRVYQTIICRMVHTTNEVAGEKEYITRGGQAHQRCQLGRDLPFNAPMKKRVKNDGPWEKARLRKFAV